MSVRTILIIMIALVFGTISIMALVKKNQKSNNIEIDIASNLQDNAIEIPLEEISIEPDVEIIDNKVNLQKVSAKLIPLSNDADLPEANRIDQLFRTSAPLLPIVETITYSSHVDWLKGRGAYLGDYAAHFHTPQHFISRSLSGQENYFNQTVSNGERFNVFRKDKQVQFHLILDLSRLKLWLYYLDLSNNERVLLKTYLVSAGRLEEQRTSGSLTPTGHYSIGNRVMVYKPGMMGKFNNEMCEMVTVFGMRWIPFERELDNCTGPAKGLGLHGVPWKKDEATGHLVECRDSVGKYESEGCVRLLSEDIQIFAIIGGSKPTFIQIVRDFQEAKLPGTRTHLRECKKNSQIFLYS